MAHLQSVAAPHTLRAQRTLNEFQTMPRAWWHTFNMSDWALRLTPEEATARVSITTHILPELDVAVPLAGSAAGTAT